jgi:hypothetical protein
VGHFQYAQGIDRNGAAESAVGRLSEDRSGNGASFSHSGDNRIEILSSGVLALNLPAEALGIADELETSRVARCDTGEIRVCIDAYSDRAYGRNSPQTSFIVPGPSARVGEQDDIAARRPLGKRQSDLAVTPAVERKRRTREADPGEHHGKNEGSRHRQAPEPPV